MSHFTVAVIHSKDKRIEDLLAPYNENSEKYLEFVECDKEDIDKYENHKEAYNSLDEFMYFYHGYEFNKETGKYGYWTNTNAQWNWYEVGGRWNGLLKTKDGKRVNEALVKDIDFSIDKDKYNEAIRFWELYIEKGYDNLTEEEKDELGFVFYKPEYFTERYKDKKIYAKVSSSFNTFAVIDNNGKWYEKGEMGWFGVSFDTPEESYEWDINYFDRFIKGLDEDMIITIVDCHI